jgi:hypothetical protein
MLVEIARLRKQNFDILAHAATRTKEKSAAKFVCMMQRVLLPRVENRQVSMQHRVRA